MAEDAFNSHNLFLKHTVGQQDVASPPHVLLGVKPLFVIAIVICLNWSLLLLIVAIVFEIDSLLATMFVIESTQHDFNYLYYEEKQFIT